MGVWGTEEETKRSTNRCGDLVDRHGPVASVRGKGVAVSQGGEDLIRAGQMAAYTASPIPTTILLARKVPKLGAKKALAVAADLPLVLNLPDSNSG